LDEAESWEIYRRFYVELGWRRVGTKPTGDLIVAIMGAYITIWKHMDGDLDIASTLGLSLTLLVPYGFKNLRMD